MTIRVKSFFGQGFSTRTIRSDLPEVDKTHNAVVILSLRGYHELGSTFITVLDRYVKALSVCQSAAGQWQYLDAGQRQPGGP